MTREDEAPSPRDEPPTLRDLYDIVFEDALKRRPPLRHRIADWWRGFWDGIRPRR